MSQKLDKHVLSNGMVLLGERIEAVASAAFVVLLPSGAAFLPENMGGACNVITDWIFRGAGPMNSRQLVGAMDGLGLHRSCGADGTHISTSGALEATNLHKAIDLFAEVILRPRLEDDQFAFARDLAVQELEGLADDPRQKVMLDLRQQFYPCPLGRNPMGTMEELQSLQPAAVRQIVRDGFDLSNAIFSVAGKYDWDAVCSQMERLFGGEPNKPMRQVTVGSRGKATLHQPNEGAQVHIGLMVPSVKVDDPGYYDIRAAVDVLGGGMSSRLFTEVREKRGLCYAVGARYHCLKDYAGVQCYAGTSPEKAQETFDVIIAEFRRLASGVGDEELQRAKAGLKSSLIMSGESTSGRAHSIASDWYLLGRVRSLDEVKAAIDSVAAKSVAGSLAGNPFDDFTVVTIGPREVEIKK